VQAQEQYAQGPPQAEALVIFVGLKPLLSMDHITYINDK
jgi:hypothetical protein